MGMVCVGIGSMSLIVLITMLSFHSFLLEHLCLNTTRLERLHIHSPSKNKVVAYIRLLITNALKTSV